MSSVQVIGFCGGRAALRVCLSNVQPYKVTEFGPPAALLQTLCEQNACGASLGNALHVRSKSRLYEFTELKFLSVGSQLPPKTLHID